LLDRARGISFEWLYLLTKDYIYDCSSRIQASLQNINFRFREGELLS